MHRGHEVWGQRYWRAYAWAHNNHHPSGNRLNQFAKAYADANEGVRSAQPVTDFWNKWIAGEVEEHDIISLRGA